MSAGTYNMCVDQGATFIRTFTWYTCSCGTCSTSSCGCGCGTGSGTPVDLTGFTADMQIRQNVQSTTILYEASTTNGAIVLGGTAGTITLTIPAASSSGFTWNKGVYDMNLTSSGGVVTRLLQGAVVVSPEVTR
jgi:hypothetical protein